ncbi:DNA-binding protein [Candidatus Collierbacteria bacterium RIFOXYB1_FULL_49_13]|uniref:DNA-binding protein n=1 Tax=Candidatus Collierbacteria bacterium RIFOXYB1_FULL_49_13 TaxID=1817728 RepID=A0A1F5FJX0_9BACT|nr:MAG: DNA-binding protein [Candidatus Collierbacteria bacterium RIFOXYB1_FULL_49_13]
MKKKIAEIVVKTSTIRVIKHLGEDYLCLTDMVKNYGGDVAIYSWLRNRNTVEFLGVWELLNNVHFKGSGFETFKRQVGLNSFHLTPKKWIDNTGAIGLISKAGRYGGGTYAHKDIAFEFGSWLSADFKLYLIKEFQRLKEQETKQGHWDYRRFLTKVNWHIQTSTIQQLLIPLSQLPINKQGIIYATEAEIINIALFGITSREWRHNNQDLAKTGNIRDHATIEQLTVMANLESINSMLITQGLDKEQRFTALRKEAIRQLTALLQSRTPLTPTSPDEFSE